ncbi:MAG: Asp-tRNA(Asn)/Glu-tRNA(Gln) amidotransferase subunit GatB [Coriobacteriales bacterium]|jgi:aspartyl-tRNA(Asn)/glutamyl-tRNA(Gln) amidotransferase subunit B|nr:Asp-tRNA(Asn)/Glu-tRNA(Gln) amidotransferase subunit GatB [Coriobacteriales bacterium]
MRDLRSVLRDWEAVIGLEVHVELTTLKTKMFCSCPIEYGAPPNTHVCPVCLGLPGALPVPNRAAIESIVLAGLATGCEIMKRSMFYRKNYFYPDMSKNFQTTQGPIAFCMNGRVELEVSGSAADEREDRGGTLPLDEASDDGSSSGSATTPADDGSAPDPGYRVSIGITRIHLEEDAGKMIHVGGTDGRISGAEHSLVDYNRCGTPLIELVTEPDLRTPQEARLFLQKLRQIYLALAISDCSMEEGSLRCDGNVSLRPRGSTTLGVKTELKNMNSFKNLHDGLAYEICRQAEVLEAGGTVLQETRHWEPASKRTITMRVKETADDYRLFPEPDLAPYDLSDEFIEGVRARLPELPDAKRRRYREDFGLPPADAAALAADVELSAFFDASVRLIGDERVPLLAKPVANLLLNDLTAYLNAKGTTLAKGSFTPRGIVDLALLLSEETISSKQAKEVLSLMAEAGEAPSAIVKRLGMRQLSDSGALEAAIEGVLADNPGKVEEYRGGKVGLLGFFVGQVMKATAGQGNPRLINEMLRERLDGERKPCGKE